MASKRKSSNRTTDEAPVIQLSSHQLILAISTILVAGCLVFLAGGFVVSYDQTLFGEKADAFPDPEDVQARQPSAPRPNPAERQTPAVQGVQQSPRRVELRQTADAAPSATAGQRSGPNSIDIPAPPPKDPQVASVKDPAPPAPPKAEPKPPEKPVETEPAKPAAAPELDKPAEADKQMAAAKSPEPDADQPAPEETADPAKPVPAANSNGDLFIQLVAFTADNQKGADEFQKTVLEKHGLIVKLVPSGDGQHIRALLGPYQTRAEAEEALGQVKGNPAFKGCFIRTGAA